RDYDLLPKEGQHHAVELALAIPISDREARRRQPLRVDATLQAAPGNSLNIFPGPHRARQFLFDRMPNVIAQTNQVLKGRINPSLLAAFPDLIEHAGARHAVRQGHNRLLEQIAKIDAKPEVVAVG